MTNAELLVACFQATWRIRTAVFLHASELFCNMSEGEKAAILWATEARSHVTSG